MTTLQGLVQHAVRRDLERTRILLSTQLTITRQRREALAHHLVWLAELVSLDDALVATATARLEHAAREFYGSTDRIQRRDVLVAVTSLLQLSAERDSWARPVALPQLGKQVHWLVDGLEARVCDHVTRLLTPHSPLTPLRLRGEVYRYRKGLLWGGTPAYGGVISPVSR